MTRFLSVAEILNNSSKFAKTAAASGLLPLVNWFHDVISSSINHSLRSRAKTAHSFEPKKQFSKESRAMC